MTSFTSNLTAADMIARDLIAERVAAAQHRAQVRTLKAANRAAKRAAKQTSRPHARPTASAQDHTLPLWATRFMFPAR